MAEQCVVEFLASAVDQWLTVFTQGLAQACAGLGCGEEVDPFGLRIGVLRGEYLHLVAGTEPMVQGHQFVVDLAGYAAQADVAVERERHVEDSGSGRQREQFALGGEHYYFRREQVELERVEEVDGARLWVVEYVLDRTEPYGQLAFFVAFADFIFPVGGKTSFGDVVHAPGSYLDLNPVAVVAHHGEVECLIAVGFRHGDPVARAVGVELVDVGYG